MNQEFRIEPLDDVPEEARQQILKLLPKLATNAEQYRSALRQDFKLARQPYLKETHEPLFVYVNVVERYRDFLSGVMSRKGLRPSGDPRIADILQTPVLPLEVIEHAESKTIPTNAAFVILWLDRSQMYCVACYPADPQPSPA